MKVYISGPITGTDDYKERFAAAQAKYERMGMEVINPVDVAEVFPELEYGDYIKIDAALLKAADAVIFFTGA